MRQPPSVPGADAVVAWWGRWVGFHDFYLLSLPPAGTAAGEMRIHGWVTHPEVDERGAYRQDKHCIVHLSLSGIRTMELSSPDLPAILFTLQIEGEPGRWTITWDSSYGCEGTIEAAAVSLAVEPGRPE